MASFDYNPITGQLDLVGSGGGTSYIDGDVEYHSNLPVTVGTPAVNSAFLVRKGEGLYFISRKPAGIWVRELNNGNLDDWKYAGTFSDLYRDANFRIINDADTSKELAFSLSGITTGTTRTLTAPDASGTIALNETFAAPPAIGNTTPNSGAFTTLTANNGTITADASALTVGQTWNNAAPTYKTVVINVTNTGGSNTAINYPLEIQSGGTAVASIALDGRIRFGGILATGSGTSWATWLSGTYNNATAINSPLLVLGGGGTGAGSAGARLQTEGVDNVLALRNGTSPQEWRVYNTSSSSNANYERGFMRWSSNVLQIGTEKAGTGSARALEFQTDGTTRWTITTAGLLTVLPADSGGFILSNGWMNYRAGSTNHWAVVSGNITARSAGYFQWSGQSDASNFSGDTLRLSRPSGGALLLEAGTTTTHRFLFGGTTSSFPALKRNSTTLEARLADDSAYTAIQGKLTTETAYTAGAPTATGYLVLYDSNGTAYKVPAEAL